jgi:uncharacterized protein YcfL
MTMKTFVRTGVAVALSALALAGCSSNEDQDTSMTELRSSVEAARADASRAAESAAAAERNSAASAAAAQQAAQAAQQSEERTDRMFSRSQRKAGS